MAGVMEKFRLDGKVAWITGASYGLGLAYAQAYAEGCSKGTRNTEGAKNRSLHIRHNDARNERL